MQDSKLKEKQAELQHKEEDLQRKAELLEQKILEIAAETDKETVSTDKEVGGAGGMWRGIMILCQSTYTYILFRERIGLLGLNASPFAA